MNSLKLSWVLWLSLAVTARATTNRYLFVGHPRADGPGEIVQREIERVDFAQYDLLMLGGDYTWSPTASRSTPEYLDAVFGLSSPGVMAVFGNHDTDNKDYFTDVTGHPSHYVVQTNNIVFAVLDTTDDGQDILGDELRMLQDTVASLSNCTHLVVVHHHILWLADYAPLADLAGDERIGASSADLSNLNFFDEVYPLLRQAADSGVEVVCIGGDRTGSETEEFHIEHETADGIHFLAAGCMEELPAEMRTVIELEHDTEAGTLSWNFVRLSDLPQIADEPVVVSEIHYGGGEEGAFVEIENRGGLPYDLSEAFFAQGLEFTFPSQVVLAPGERILVASDPSRFLDSGVRVFDASGSGGLIDGEPLWLRDRNRLEIDYVPYGRIAPWPPGANGSGKSLSLIRPDLDNQLPESWALSDGESGTPAEANFTATLCTNMVLGDSALYLDWSGTVDGARYRLEWTPELVAAPWQPVEETNAVASAVSFASATQASEGFYRLQRLFPVYPPPVFTNLILSGSVWKYLDTGGDPGPGWTGLEYDDGAWASGASELGYGDGDESTVVGYGPSSSARYATTHFRCRFSVADASLVEAIQCRAKVDDGAIFHLNGTEVARLRMQDGPVAYSSYTTRGGNEYGFEEIAIPTGLLVSGENILAVEVHQSSATSSDLSLDVELSIGETSR